MTRMHWLVIAMLALLSTGGLAFWQEEHPAWAELQARYNAEPDVAVATVGIRALTPTSTGKPELCVTCHVGIEDISASHPAQAMGCIVCHGGDPLALDADRAHATLRGGKNPGDLSVAAENCGQPNCHGGYADPEQNHVGRVLMSLQTTYAGAIASVRYTFGLQATPAALFGIHPVQDSTVNLPARALPTLRSFLPVTGTIESKFQQSCVEGGCHLGASAPSQTYYARSTGCSACHYLYSDDGLYQGKDPTIPRDQPGHGTLHKLTTAIPYTQCDHCHNRGTYSLKQMAFLPRQDLPPAGQAIPPTMPPEGKRLKEYYQPMTEFTKCEVELECVDCHTAQEVMGPGHIYGSKKDAQYIQCQTCHGTPTTKPQVKPVQDANELAMRQARINGHSDFLNVGDRVIETTRGELLWSIKEIAPDRFVQLEKVTGKQYEVPLVAGSKCTQSGSDQSSQYCHECHSMPQ